MTGAIPRSLMTADELAAERLDDQRELDELEDAYVPTAAGLAHLGVPQPRERTIFAGHGEHAAGESTGSMSPEGRERPEGDAARALSTRPGLLARRPSLRRDETLILALGVVMCALAIAVIAVTAEPGWIQ